MHENYKSDMKSQKNMNPNYPEKKILFLPPKRKRNRIKQNCPLWNDTIQHDSYDVAAKS